MMSRYEQETATKNVIAAINAGKRQYGDRRWYWCVWIGVKRFSDCEHQEPIGSGFAKTKADARRTAWKCLSEKGHDQAYFNDFRAWENLKRREQAMPCFSRCRVGKDKWFWVVGLKYDFDADDYKEPLATGFASSPELAKRDAENECGEPVLQIANWEAKSYRQYLRALERSQALPDSSAESSPEFVYCGYKSGHISKYRIAKRTPKRIYVERRRVTLASEAPTGDWQDHCHRRAFTLDRAEFETTGRASANINGWRTEVFYADENECRKEQESQHGN